MIGRCRYRDDECDQNASGNCHTATSDDNSGRLKTHAVTAFASTSS
jgi:hypothetical protein